MRFRGRPKRWFAGLMAVALGVAACWLTAQIGGATAAGATPAGAITTIAAGRTRTAESLLPTLPIVSPTSEKVQVTVTDANASAPLPDGFLGFSVETGAIHAYLGRNPQRLNPIFLQLLEGVDQGHAPVLRIGGNSTDDTWVQLPGLLPPAGVTYTITNDWLQTVRTLAQDTGTRLILGVNLAADNPQLAGVEARSLINGVSRRAIEALEIANEPDLYAVDPWYDLPGGTPVNRRGPNYTYASYVADLNHWREIMPRGLPLAAGALALLNWLPSLDATIAADRDVRLVTMHRYPLAACETNQNASDYATLTNLLDSASTEGLAGSVASAAATLRAGGRQLRIDELNSASCEGANGVSNTFGSALWILNVLFDFAAAGVDGVNVHTLPGAVYAPFSFTETDGHWSATVNPIYYGMLMFASAFPPGGELLSSSDSSSDIKAYTTRAPDGQLHTTIINENSTLPGDVTLSLPGAPASLTAETLTAPALNATTGVALGGQSFSDPTGTGELPRPTTSTVTSQDGSFDVTVAPDSAVLLTGS